MSSVEQVGKCCGVEKPAVTEPHQASITTPASNRRPMNQQQKKTANTKPCPLALHTEYTAQGMSYVGNIVSVVLGNEGSGARNVGVDVAQVFASRIVSLAAVVCCGVVERHTCSAVSVLALWSITEHGLHQRPVVVGSRSLLHHGATVRAAAAPPHLSAKLPDSHTNNAADGPQCITAARDTRARTTSDPRQPQATMGHVGWVGGTP